MTELDAHATIRKLAEEKGATFLSLRLIPDSDGNQQTKGG